MKNRVLYVLLLILLSGCGRPWGVLSHDDMVNLLLDVHVAEASMKILDSGAKRIEKQEYYNTVFEKHNTTKEQFDKSLDWYSRHPKELIAIYDDVKKEAAALQTRVEAYEFHPDMKPTLEDSLETFDLWHWYVENSFQLDEDSVLPIDSLHFAITDTSYFYKSESLQFYLKMRAYAPDSVQFTTRLVFHYSDSVVDTLQYVSLADSICRRYRFNQVFSDVRDLDSLFIEIVDSARTIETIEIDSIELNRVYNKKLYPINRDLKNKIKEIRDSLSGKEYKSEAFTVKNRWKI
ncbi:MAG: DUF4296 domain-containing protein [Paludibacteraceae bacterium]|nr:DUF4296 domain-containing protein [Paludibacteraceae bacterium]